MTDSKAKNISGLKKLILVEKIEKTLNWTGKNAKSKYYSLKDTIINFSEE